MWEGDEGHDGVVVGLLSMSWFLRKLFPDTEHGPSLHHQARQKPSPAHVICSLHLVMSSPACGASMTSSAKLQTCREGLSNQCLPVSTKTHSL